MGLALMSLFQVNMQLLAHRLNQPATGGTTEGSAYIFVRSGTSWSQQAKLVASDAASGDAFGMGVSIDGDYAVNAILIALQILVQHIYLSVAAQAGPNKQSLLLLMLKRTMMEVDVLQSQEIMHSLVPQVRVIPLELHTYTIVAAPAGPKVKLTASDAADYDAFSFGLDLDGEYALLGAPQNDDGGQQAGSAYIYYGDTTAPTISSVSSTTTNGSYKIDDVIAITIAFSESVTVSSTPQLTLETGSSDAVVNYSSGSGSSTLTFNYTVASSHTSSDLDYKATNSLALNSGTIRDAAGNNANLTLASPGASGSLGANKALVVDTTIPTISSASLSSDNNTLTIIFSESVYTSSDGTGALETGDFVINKWRKC